MSKYAVLINASDAWDGFYTGTTYIDENGSMVLLVKESDKSILARWRLVLGRSAEQHGITCEGDESCDRIEKLVGFVFDTESGAGKAPPRGRSSGPGSTTLALPDWVNHVHELFPNKAKEVLEKTLIQRRGIAGLLEDPRLLEKVEANVDLVKTLLTNKELLNPKTVSIRPTRL